MTDPPEVKSSLDMLPNMTYGVPLSVTDQSPMEGPLSVNCYLVRTGHNITLAIPFRSQAEAERWRAAHLDPDQQPLWQPVEIDAQEVGSEWE